MTHDDSFEKQQLPGGNNITINSMRDAESRKDKTKQATAKGVATQQQQHKPTLSGTTKPTSSLVQD